MLQMSSVLEMQALRLRFDALKILQCEEQSSEEQAKVMAVSKAQADAEQPAGDKTRVPEHPGSSDTETLDDSDDEADSEESTVTPSHPKSPVRATKEVAAPAAEKPKTLREIRQNVSASTKKKYKTKCSVSEAD